MKEGSPPLRFRHGDLDDGPLQFWLFFCRSTSGWQVVCDIDSDYSPCPYRGLLKGGREFTRRRGAMRYAQKYVHHRQAQEPEFEYHIHAGGLA